MEATHNNVLYTCPTCRLTCEHNSGFENALSTDMKAELQKVGISL